METPDVSSYQYPEKDTEIAIAIRADFVMEILKRSRRYGTDEVTGDLGYSDASINGFYIFFYRTSGERDNGRRLSALIVTSPRSTVRICAVPHLLCFGARLPRNFWLLPH